MKQFVLFACIVVTMFVVIITVSNKSKPESITDRITRVCNADIQCENDQALRVLAKRDDDKSRQIGD